MCVDKASAWMRRWRGALLVGFALLVVLSPSNAFAHIKWFAPFDLSKPPLAIGEVLNTTFVRLYLLSIICIYVFFYIDRLAYRKRFLTDTLTPYTLNNAQSFWIMRISISVFFFALFLMGISGSGILLTLELRTDRTAIHILQLLIAGFALYRPSTPLVGVGIIILYAIGLWQYGIFHMLDYLVFLGIAVYFLLTALSDKKWVTVGYVTLFATTGLSLLWSAIEKWGYPGWFYTLLDANPALMMGMEQTFYVILAGFVEFNIVFILLGSVSMFSRVIAFVLEAVFILAVYIFGWVDFVGHLLIIAIVLILILRGPTSAREFLALPDKSLWAEAYFMTGLYILALNVMFLAYYGIYSLTH